MPHIAKNLTDTFHELLDEFSLLRVRIKQTYNYPEIQQFHFIDIEGDFTLATVTVSPGQITVVDDVKRIAHTFLLSAQNPLSLVNELTFDPLLWSFHMARHANNNAVDECYEWDWEEYTCAVDAMLCQWEKDLKDAPKESECWQAFADIRTACEEVMNIAPSLPDLRALERKWSDPDYDLFNLVPVDDYFIFSRQYLQALVIINLLVIELESL